MADFASNYLDKDVILETLIEQDIINIVRDLGSGMPRRDSKGNLVFQTICHNIPNTKNSWKLYYYFPDKEHKYGNFFCYSKCHDSFNIIELCIRAKRTQGVTFTWYQALHYIARLSNKLDCKISNLPEQKQLTNPDFEWINKLNSLSIKSITIPEFKPLNEELLEIFCYVPHETWLKDHISREAMSRYEISYYGLNNSIIIPHRDRHNQLIGVRQRFLDAEDVETLGKYMPLQLNGKFLAHSLGNNLYGINVTQNKIKSCKKCLLVESEKGCMQVYSYFGEDAFALAVCGSHLSQVQINLLLQYLQISEVIIGFDKEYHDLHSYEAELYYNNLLKIIAPLVNIVKVTMLIDSHNLLNFKDSPTDQGKEILLQLLEEKITITPAEVQRVMGELT